MRLPGHCSCATPFPSQTSHQGVGAARASPIEQVAGTGSFMAAFMGASEACAQVLLRSDRGMSNGIERSSVTAVALGMMDSIFLMALVSALKLDIEVSLQQFLGAGSVGAMVGFMFGYLNSKPQRVVKGSDLHLEYEEVVRAFGGRSTVSTQQLAISTGQSLEDATKVAQIVRPIDGDNPPPIGLLSMGDLLLYLDDEGNGQISVRDIAEGLYGDTTPWGIKHALQVSIVVSTVGPVSCRP